MKKYMLATLFLIVFVCFVEPAQKLLSNFLRIEEPTIHQITDGDWLSKIAKEYYGDISYWRELELINRAPEGNLIFPGEKIIVPSFSVVQKIRNTRKLSEVNELVREQQDLVLSQAESWEQIDNPGNTEPEESVVTIPVEYPDSDKPDVQDQIAGIERDIAKSQPTEPSFANSLLLAGAVVLGALFILGIFLFIRKRKKDEVNYYGADVDEKDTESVHDKEEKSVYFGGFDDNGADDKKEEKKKVKAELV